MMRMRILYRDPAPAAGRFFAADVMHEWRKNQSAGIYFGLHP